MPKAPRPRDNATIIAVAIDGTPLTWLGWTDNPDRPSHLYGTGTPDSHALVTRAHDLWTNPQRVDHPSWKRSVLTEDTTALGVLATLLFLGAGRGVILDAPDDVVADLFMKPTPAPEQSSAQSTLIADILVRSPGEGRTWGDVFAATQASAAARADQDRINERLQGGVEPGLVIVDATTVLHGHQYVQGAVEIGLADLPVRTVTTEEGAA